MQAEHHHHVLQLDIQGTPQAWISIEQAASHYATGSVAWEEGVGPLRTLRGGWNAVIGRQSVMDIHPIIALSGASRVNLFDVTPSISKTKLLRRDRMTCVYEELVGSYDVEQQIIVLGKNTVRLTPIGTFLIGTKGRVDMEGPRGVARLLLAPKEATAPKVSFSSAASRGDKTEGDPQAIEWSWKLSTPPPHIRYIELTDDSFRAALMGVVNGHAS